MPNENFMLPYRILIHPEAYQKADTYRLELISKGLSTAGLYLQRALQGLEIEKLNTEAFIEHLFATKPTLIFAESAVYGNGKDWNQSELSILGDIGVATLVEVYDDGKHHQPRLHESPFTAILLFIPGALLRNGNGNTPVDWDEVTLNNHINPLTYLALYERRLLPLFIYANEQAKLADKSAFITLPGLGCGQFAGAFEKQLGVHLKNALVAILTEHARLLPYLKAVYFDPYNECENERIEFGSVSLLVRPLTKGNQNKSQLCPPTAYAEEGDDYSNCLLFSIVAWDHVSWPGNDFYAGSRSTDDGVKAAATNSMMAMTGIKGKYNTVTHCYEPPPNYKTWTEVVKQNNLKIKVTQNLSVLPSIMEETS